MLKENSSITEALKALYRANNAGIWLWVSKGALKFKAPEHTDATGILDLLKAHKVGILDILQENGMVDDKPVPFCIYRIPEAAMPLSFAQQRLWFVQQLDAGTSAYHIPAVYELPEDADLKGIRYALEQIVERHEILRSTINQQGNQETAMQTAHHGALPIEELSSDTENYVSLIRQEISRPFDLKKDYPLRATLLHIRNTADTGKSRTFLLINSHHIANDGWSSELLEAELKAYYEAYSKGDLSFRLPELRIQYKDYAFWQRCYLSQEVLESQLDYWKTRLSGFQTLALPTDYPRPTHTDYAGSDTEFKLNSKLSEKLRAMARKLGVTMHSIMLSGFHILLSKYTRQDDIVTGSPNANRHHPQTGNLIGFFINAQINRTILYKQQSFEELILQMHRDQMDSQLYQDLPFEKLVNELNIDRSSSRHPVFQIIFEVQGSSEEEQQRVSPHGLLTRHELRDYYNIERFDLSIFVNDSTEEIHTTMTYATSLFRQETIAYLGLHYSALLESLVQAPEQPYSLISPFDASSGILDAEKELLLHDFNNITPNYDGTYRSVVSLFKAQAEQYPDKTALRFRGSDMSYRQLDEWSDMLASHLISRLPASGPNRVGILLDRSDNLIVSVLAVLKAGAAYVPVDPAYPDQRKSHIINDAGITLLITQSDYLFSLDYYTGEVFAIDIELELLEKTTVAEADLEGHQLAYVIYTSGSTGQPKGCGIRHSNLSHYIQWANHYYFSSEAHGNFGLYTSLSFDLTVTSIFCCLSRGKTLTVYPQDMDLPQILEHSFSKASGIDSIKITPSHIRLLEPMHLHTSGIRAAIVGGEAIGRDHIDILKGIDANIRIYNEYGPTETTVGCVVQELEPDAPVVIGKPIYGAKLYILNETSELLPVGMTGEICIAGMGVGAGYLNKPQLNESKFIANPFESGQSLYRTGDLGRWLPDGTIDYRGRFDEQVKVRGYRIELGEIEHSLMQTNLFRSVCVIVKDRQVNQEQQRSIVAYYVPKDPASEPDHGLVQEELMKFLPDYMVPALFIGLKEFPLTINGKIDKAVLPDPVFDSHAVHVAPDSETEEEFCRLWMEVLGLQQVGVTDDFFNIGGDSILSIRLVARLKQAGFQLSVRDIFNFRTIRDIIPHASHVQQDAGTGYEPFSYLGKEEIGKIVGSNQLDRNALQDLYPASYLQAGMLIESAAGQHAYLNVDSFIIGTSFDQNRFETIWQKLVDKHEQLRTAFIKHHTGYLNIVYKSITLPEKITIVSEPAETLEKLVDLEKQVGFDLNRPGLFRLIVVPGSGSFTLLFSHHHALADGWSVAFLMADFANAYMNDGAIHTEVLPSFGKFIQAELRASKAEAHKAFWTEYLRDHELSAAPFSPSTKPATAGHSYVQRHLVPELNSALLDLARSLKVPVDVVFMGIYNLALGKFYDNRDLVIGTATNNRLEEEGGDRVFGLHLNTIPIRFITAPGNSMQDYLLSVLEQKSRIEEHKLYPYAQIKSDLRKEENLYHCSFNYVHFHVEEKNYKSRISKQVYSAGTTSLPLILDVTRYESTFNLALRGATDFINKETAGKMLDLMVDLLEEASLHPSKALKDFCYLPEKQYQQMVYDWNQTEKPLPVHYSIISLFEEQVGLTPDHIAVVAAGIELSYKQLQQQADKLAQYLIHDLGVKPQDKIGIMLTRSENIIISILGILKTGAAYVFIDPDYPTDRKKYITEDASLNVLVTQSDCVSGLEFYTGHVFEMDLQLNSITSTKEFSTVKIHPGDPAYIIYTSGTTGNPKGVIISHQAVISLVVNDYLHDLSHNDTFAFLSSPLFDASTFEIFTPLLKGNKLIIPKEVKNLFSDVTQFKAFLEYHHISVLWLTKTLFDSLFYLDQSVFRNLNYLLIGGEALDKQTVNKLIASEDRPRHFLNGYGPTESTTFTCVYHLENEVSSTHVPIGKPINNRTVYILDSERAVVPVGVIGELYIGGAGLATGYLNRPELTSERFVPNPFATEHDIARGHTRLYRSGDLVRWLPDGNIEYIGRNDDQVKIRGFRIEPGEIENALARIDGIRRACVLVRTLPSEAAASKYLAAYYEPEQNTPIPSSDHILDELAKKLPDYMIPATLMRVDTFPVTINGKLDKQALLGLESETPVQEHIAPSTDTEKEVCRLWEEVLGVKIVGLRDNFFRLGGSSILAIQLAHRMSTLLNYELKVSDILKSKTIEKLLAEEISRQAEMDNNIEWTV